MARSRRITRISLFTLVVVAILAMLSLGSLAASGSRSQPSPAKPTPAGQTPTAQARLRQTAEAWVATLQPLDSGPGIVVCEPVARGADATTADFGDGCGRWLYLMVGGQGDLGKTPEWWSVDRLRDELKRRDLRLSLTDAAKLAQRLGITHVAVGEIQGSAKSCTLTYQLWEVPSKKAVGRALTASGTADAVIATLPQIAAGLLRALRVTSPVVPAQVGETAEELRLLGSVPWHGTFMRVPLAQAEELHKLAVQILSTQRSHPPLLAAFLDLSYRHALSDLAQVVTLGQCLTKALPDNALVFAALGREALLRRPANHPTLPMSELDPCLRHFPNNTLFRTAECYFQRAASRVPEARAAAELAVRCSTRNPDAWLLLADGIYDESDLVRRGRYISRLTGDEMVYCTQLYEKLLLVARQAAQLDPRSSHAWRKVSDAAASLGRDELADSAFWKALNLAPGDFDIYWWGIQLYQPKWLDDPTKLARVAKLAGSAADQWTPAVRAYIAFYIHTAGLPESAERMLRTDADRAAYKTRIEASQRRQPAQK